MSSDSERQPWERMDGESVKAFSVFTSYLHMQPQERSYPNLAKSVGKKPGYVRQLERWASKWEWQARLAAWIEQQTKSIDEIRLDAQTEIIEAEFEDYHTLRKQWLEQAKYIHPVGYVTHIPQKDDDTPGKEVTVLKTDAYGFKAHIEARKKISEGLRLAAEMPSKIERSEATGKDGGAIEHDIIELTEEERAKRIAAILDNARARGTGQPDGE